MFLQALFALGVLFLELHLLFLGIEGDQGADRIDRQGRLVLLPSKYEPEELFLHRPKVNRCLSLKQMEQAIAAAAGRPVDREAA